MAESYDIHLTDPLAPAFKVKAFTSNGPKFPTGTSPSETATSISTSLLIYGKGHANYGERIAENILHVMENFSGSTVPQYPVSGQLWYARYTLLKVGAAYYEWVDDSGNINGGTWNVITVVENAAAPVVVVGGYWYDNVTFELHYGVGPAHPLGAVADTWILRVHDDIPGLGDPNSPVHAPRKVLKVYDGADWKDQNTVYTSETDRVPPTPVDGDLWLDTITGRFNYYDGAFQSVALESDLAPLVAPYLPLAGGTMTGILNMGAFSIDNVATPTQGPFPADDLKSANKIFVDVAIASALGGAVPTDLTDLDDVTITAPLADDFLYWTGTEWANKAITLSDVSDVGATAAEVNHLVGVTSAIQPQITSKIDNGGDAITGSYTFAVGGTYTMNGDLIVGVTGSLNLDGHPIINVQDPSNSQDAATMNYVDTEIGLITTSDQYVSIGILYPTGGVTGRLPEATALANELEMIYNDGTNFLISNIAAGDHIHTGAEITYAVNPETILSQLSTAPTDVSEAVDQLDQIMVKRTTNRRNVVVATAAQTTVSVVGYAAGTDSLFVYVEGLKQISSVAGEEYATFGSLNTVNTTASGLSNDATTYTAAIVVDGGGSQPISIVGSASQTFADVVVEMQADIVGATVVLEDGELLIVSDTYGGGSTIAITDTDLFLSLATFLSIDSTGATGVAHDYNEQAGYKQESGTIIFNVGLTVSDKVEAISLGDAALGII